MKGLRSRGFSLVEMVVVIVLLGVVLTIGIPNMIRWYREQRFLQNVQSIGAALRVAQFSAVNTNHWMMVVFHTRCPDLSGAPPGASERPCVQRFRLPVDQCGAVGAWPPWENVTACTSTTDPNTFCEYVQDRWFEPVSAPMELIDAGNIPDPLVLIFSPQGLIAWQSEPFQDTTSMAPQCQELAGPELQIIQTNMNFIPLRFGWPKGMPYIYQGLCMTGMGRVYMTAPGKTSSLNC